MVRLCFSRKNKTLAAIFKQKRILEMICKNYVTHCSLNGKEPEEVLGTLEGMKEKLMAILDRIGFSEKRSNKIEQDEFLEMLITFNRDGIHFV